MSLAARRGKLGKDSYIKIKRYRLPAIGKKKCMNFNGKKLEEK